MKDKLIALPVETVERLIDMAAGARGVNDLPTLMMFSDVRLQIERAKQAK
jgi:hypothetical protein